MQQMFPQVEPPNRSNSMKFIGSPFTLLIATLVGTVIGAIISAMILGTAHIIDFSWLMLILGCVTLAIMGTFIWASYIIIRTIQEQYQRDVAAMNADKLAFKDEMRKLVTDGIARLEEWKISYANQNAKEQKEHFDKLAKQCMEAIADAESRMDSSVKGVRDVFSGAVDSNNRAVKLYGEQLIHALNQMKALEERLRQELKPKDEE